MPSSGPNSGSTFATDSSIGPGSVFNPERVGASDDVYPSCNLGVGVVGEGIKATGFGFAIPTGATIDGILVEWEQRRGGTGIRDHTVRLYKAGVLVGTNKADTATDYPTTDTYRSYGGAADLWGTTWTAAQVNATDFGAVLAAQNAGAAGAAAANIDHVRITVYYTAAASGGTVPRRRSSTRTLRAM